MNRTFPSLRRLLLLASLLACASAAPAEEPAPEPASDAAWGGDLKLSYDSLYMLYGYRFGRDLMHADASAWRSLDARTTVWAGSWYGYLPAGDYHEVDVYAGLDRDLGGGFSAGLAYTLFNYLETPFPTKRHVNEFAGHVTFAAGPVKLSVRDHYDTWVEGHLIRVLAAFSRPVAGPVSIEASAEFGYAFRYYVETNQPNHALFILRLPCALGGGWTLTPFVAQSLALGAIDAFEEDRTYGGLSAHWSW
jgi:hypothetical protein